MSNQQIPGLLFPTVTAQIGNSQRESAIVAGNDTALKMNKMSNELAGGRKRRYRRGGANGNGTIVVPQFHMSYTPQNGPGQDPNAQIQQNAAIGTQAAANSVYDSQALKMGGTLRRSYKRHHRRATHGKKSTHSKYSKKLRRTFKRKSRRNHKK